MVRLNQKGESRVVVPPPDPFSKRGGFGLVWFGWGEEGVGVG